MSNTKESEQRAEFSAIIKETYSKIGDAMQPPEGASSAMLGNVASIAALCMVVEGTVVSLEEAGLIPSAMATDLRNRSVEFAHDMQRAIAAGAEQIVNGTDDVSTPVQNAPSTRTKQ